MVPKILGSFPDHSQYWELCCGTCSIFKRKNSVPSFLVDLNAEIVNKALTGYVSECRHTYLQACVFDVLAVLVEKNSYMGHGVLPDAFLFMDPPWRVSKLGKKQPLYKNSLSDNDTARLLLLARRVPYKMAILHYTDELYDDILNDWHRVDFNVSFSGRVCSVSLYCNYDPLAVKLALPTLAGKNRTDRQRIKRKASDLVSRLDLLPAYERQVILEALKKKFEL